ncbi:MAG TPA: glycosyltransferase family 39 protein, partial [Kineosporiaceae bacterium]|nr:glycosyltransferase family 39 protein [Kineosporiaceae bacterium]
GGTFAQGQPALAVGSGAFTLVAGHLLATSAADFGVWVTVTWLITVILRTGRQGLWLAVGAVLGIGLLNKQLPVFLMFALLVGMLLTSTARPAPRTPWPYLGGLVAAVGWAPVLLWQARHAWPQLTLAGQIHDEYGQLGARIGAAALQVVLFSIGATALWALGLWWLFRDPRWRRYRPLAWAWPVLMMASVWVCDQPVGGWTAAWPRLMHLSA